MIEPKIKQIVSGNMDLDGIKRLQVPDAVIDIKCPKCGEECDIQLIDKIYYPADPSSQDGTHEVAFECENCEIEVGRKIKIVSVIVTFEVGESEIL